MTIFKEIESKPQVYLSLFLILITGGVAFFAFSPDTYLQRRIVYATGGAYFIWSLLHHYQRGDLHLSIVIEYLLIIVLGVLILSSTLI